MVFKDNFMFTMKPTIKKIVPSFLLISFSDVVLLYLDQKRQNIVQRITVT